jgi:hypothetical protein
MADGVLDKIIVTCFNSHVFGYSCGGTVVLKVARSLCYGVLYSIRRFCSITSI